MGFLFGEPKIQGDEKIKEIYERADRVLQEGLLKAERVFEGLDERDRALMIAANIGLITSPARLSTRLEAYRRIMDGFDYMLSQEGISAIATMLEAERTLLKQTWWGEFVEDWREKWSIHNENDIGFWGYRYKKLQQYVYEFGYYYQTPADYKDNGPLKLPANVGHIGPRKIISWRVDIKSNSVAPIILPVSNQLEKGLVLASGGSNEEAIIEFNRYIKMRPNDPMAYIVRGDSYDDMGQFEKAINDYSKSIELEPRLVKAYDKRATAYVQLGDFERALQDYNKAIVIHPEEAQYYFNMSQAYNGLGDIDKTITSYTKAIELDQNFAEAYYNRGIAYNERGEYDKAISDYDIAIQLQPEFIVDVYFNRGLAYQGKGEYKKALEDFKWVRKHVSDREDIEVVEQKIRELTKGDKMGLFRKKKADYRQAALDMYLENIYKTAESQFEYSCWYSWGAGAWALLEGLNKIPGCEMVPDSPGKAKLLLEVGIQAMISFWYRNWESQESHSDEEKEMARKIALGNTQTFLGINSEDSIKLYLGFDRELQCVLNGERNTSLYYVGMFYQRCRECITGEQIADWGKLKFPIESYQQFMDVCHADKYLDLWPDDSLRVFGAICFASGLMFNEFERVYKKNIKEL